MPISEARRAAARANGAKSQGPVTPEGKAKSAQNAITHGLTASAIVLTTESKEKYEALLASYLERCNPDGPIEIDLVEEIVAAKWQQRRVATMITALMDVTMDRMEKEIRDEFENIDNGVRTVLAFEKEAKQSATLALLNRYAARHAREYHRALRQLREIQSERRDQNDPPPAPNEKSQNEPKPDTTPEPSITSDPEATTETGYQPPAPGHCEANSSLATSHSQLILQNEPKPDVTPDPSTISDHEVTAPDLATETETGHRPLATDHCSSETGHRPLAIDHSTGVVDFDSGPHEQLENSPLPVPVLLKSEFRDKQV
jgi:hypothetical protein